MCVILGSYFVPLEVLTFSISYCMDNIKYDIASNSPQCPLNNGVFIVQKLVKPSKTSTTFSQQAINEQRKKRTTYSQNILHGHILHNIKTKKYKTVFPELAFAKVTFDRMVMIFLWNL